jgi:hypothetical protein
MAATAFLCGGCRPGTDEDMPEQTVSQLIVMAEIEEVAARSAGGEEVTVFTGDDILWFNGSTRELRFRDNVSNSDNISNKRNILNFHAIRFYINGEYLFSSMTYASGYSSQTFNSLVFYYNTIENRFYLVDGYPIDVSVLPDPQKARETRDGNAKKIEPEWNRFVDWMKQEGRYK